MNSENPTTQNSYDLNNVSLKDFLDSAVDLNSLPINEFVESFELKKQQIMDLEQGSKEQDAITNIVKVNVFVGQVGAYHRNLRSPNLWSLQSIRNRSQLVFNSKLRDSYWSIIGYANVLAEKYLSN